MPIYEYFCPGCNARFELMRSVTQSSENATCSRCHKEARRVLSRFCSVSRSEGGVTTPIGGGSCSGCSASSCSTCGG